MQNHPSVDLNSLGMMGVGMNPMINPMGMGSNMNFGMNGQNIGNINALEMLRNQIMEQAKKNTEKNNEEK